MEWGKTSNSYTIVYFVLLAILTAVIFIGFRVFKSYKNRVWNYTGRLNILNKQELILTSIPNKKGVILKIKLPPDAYVKVPDGHGDYKLKNVFELGKTEGRGEELLLKTVSFSLGVPVDTENEKLTFWDKIKIWRIKRESQSRVKQIDLSKLSVFTEKKRIDGSVIEKIDPDRVDFYLKELFWETSFREESLAIAVFNAGSFPGLAEETAREIENIGGKIVEASNWKEKTSVCQIKTSKKFKKSITLERLKKIFSCSVFFEEIPLRFDILLIIN